MSNLKWPDAATDDACALVAVCGRYSLAALGRREPPAVWTVGNEQPHGRLVWHGSRLVLEQPGVGHAGWQVAGMQVPCPRHGAQGHMVDVVRMFERLEEMGGAIPKKKPVYIGVADVLWREETG